MVKTRAAKISEADHEVLKGDLAILLAMVDGMGDYLASDITWWDMGQTDMPLLTIGGYLMRRRRLGLLDALLHDDERKALAAANERYDRAVSTRIVRFEARALAEFGLRLREWTVYLRDLAVSKRLAADTERYSYLADTRVVMGRLVHKLSESPFRLPEHLPADVAALDNRLKYRWTPGAFIWSPVWTAAYPRDEYWWLYGRPKKD